MSPPPETPRRRAAPDPLRSERTDLVLVGLSAVALGVGALVLVWLLLLR